MIKTLVLLGILQCFLAVHHVSADPSNSSSDHSDDEQSSDEGYDSEDGSGSDNDDERDTKEELPNFNCITFGHSSCHAACSLVASIYGTSSKGSCDSSQICRCSLDENSLASLWWQKFYKDDASIRLLQKITKDSKLKKAVHKVLLEYPRTPFESIEDLKEQFPNTKEFQKLKPTKRKIPVLKYINDDELDREALRKYLSSKIRQSLKSGHFTVSKPDYESQIKSYLKKHYSLPKVYNEAKFAKFLTKLFPKNKIEQIDEELDTSDEITNIAEYSVIQEFFNYVDKKPSKTTKPSKSNKKSSKGKWITPEPPTSFSVSRNGSSVKQWDTENLHAQWSKASNGSIELSWIRGKTKIILNKQSNGTITQSWQFDDDVVIQISNYRNGSIEQSWKIRGNTYNYIKSSNGSVQSSGIISKKDLDFYKDEITSWCKENTELFETNNCIIFNKL